MLAVSMFALAAPLRAQTVNATVDVNTVKAILPLEGLGMGTAVYANQFANPQLDERLNEAGITTLRYSGGGYADVYHWSVHKDSPFFGTNDRGYVASATTFPGLLNIMNNMGNGQAVITVNYGSALKLNAGGTITLAPDYGGQPQEAAAWVAYTNAGASIYGNAELDVTLGVDAQGNNWRTAGYWAKLRASTPTEYQSWATADGVYNSTHQFLAINRDSPVGIKYWEIGNETFGTGYYGGGTGYSTDYHVPYDGTNRDDHPDLSPAHYGDQVVAYSQLMKQVDPTIKIGAVLATPPDDYSWSYADLNDNGVKNSNEPYWNDEVLAHAASAIDFVMVHWYPWVGEAYTSYTDTNWNDNPPNGQFDYIDSVGGPRDNNRYDPGEVSEPVTGYNTGTTLVAFPRQKINQMINGTTSGLDSGTNRGIKDSLVAHGIPNAEIMVTEFNHFGYVWNGDGWIANPQNATDYATPAFALFAADSYATWLENGVRSVQMLEMSKEEFIGDQVSLTRGPGFYAIRMLNHMADPGDAAVAATSSSNNVRVHAALQDDGTVAVMILNLNETSRTINVTINGDPLSEVGTRYITAGVGIASSTAFELGNSFTVTDMPGRSNYLFLIPPVPELPGDFNKDGFVDAADFVYWQKSGGSSGDYMDWQENFGRTNESGSGATSTVPEPAAWLILTAGMVLLAGRARSRRGPSQS
jgi:hypothetical protein